MPSEDAAWREVGHRVATRRVGLGIPTQLELAERAGVHKNTVSKIELGQMRRQGRSWAPIERELGWPAGTLMGMYREIAEQSARVPAAAVEQAVLDAVNDAAPHVTVRQARRIAQGTVERLKAQGLLTDPR